MRWITSCLAILLSLFMVATPISAAACDMICALEEAHSDCHAVSVSSAGRDDRTVPMPPAMGMSSDRSRSAIENDRSATLDPSMLSDMDMNSGHYKLAVRLSTWVNSVSDHSRLMSSEMPVERVEHLPKQIGTNASSGPSKAASSCADEACSQSSASAAPSRGIHSQTVPLHTTAIGILISLDCPLSLHRTKVENAPPETRASDPLITTLRI
jgi:hypothetical protein